AVQARDQLRDARRFRGGHAGGGLVEQQDARTLSERDRELELAPLAVGEDPRRGILATGQADALQERVRRRVFASRRRTEGAIWSGVRGDRERDVLARREWCEELGPLIHPRQTESCALPGPEASDLGARESHVASCRRKLTGEHVEERGLPRTVRADDRAALAVANREGHAVEGLDATERAAQLADLDHGAPTRT